MYMYIGGSWGKGRPTKKTVRLVSLRIKVTVQGILRYRFAKIPSYPLLRTAPPLSSSSRISRSDRRPTSRSPTSRLRNPSEPTYIHIHAYIHTLFSPHTEPRSMRVVTYIRPSVHNLLLSRAHLLLPPRHSRLTGSAADTRAPIYLRTKGTNSGTGTHVRGAFSREKRQHANVEDREREREREMPSRLIPWTGRGQVSVRPCRPDRMLLPPHRLRVHHGSSLDRGIVGCTQVCTRWAGRAFLRRCRVSYIHRKAPTSSKNERERERGRDGKGYSRQGRGKGGGEEKEEREEEERERVSTGPSNESFCLFVEAIEFVRESNRCASLSLRLSTCSRELLPARCFCSSSRVFFFFFFLLALPRAHIQRRVPGRPDP